MRPEMHVAFFVFDLTGTAGTERAVVTQANALSAAGCRVSIISASRRAEHSRFRLRPDVEVRYLVDARDPQSPRPSSAIGVTAQLAARLHERESMLVPSRWDQQFTALVDVAAEEALSGLDADVLVTTIPGLLATAVQLAPSRVRIVHQEHRASFSRTGNLEPLLTFAPRADVVALLTPLTAQWLADQLGASAPKLVVVPNALRQGFSPRSTLSTGVVVAAGRLSSEKQFPLLVQAFAEISDRIPDWRLRIFGEGPERLTVLQEARRHGLYDRVELPGVSSDMAAEWARASIAALTSLGTEGMPLVIQEAMAAGVPVAAFDCPTGPRELIDHDRTGLLVAPGSTAGMASALLRLATDVELRARLGATALESSAAYRADLVARRWLEIFQEVLGGPEPRVRRRATSSAGPHEADRPALGAPRLTPRLTPRAARSRTLTVAVAAAGRAATDFFVLPPHGERPAVVVLPMSCRDRMLTELAAGAADGLELVDSAGHLWPERRGEVAELAQALRRGRTSRVTIGMPQGHPSTPDGLDHRYAVDVEFWERAPDGDLVAPQHNAFASRVPAGHRTAHVEVEGVSVPTLSSAAQPTVHECRFPVDVVYTWVDGRDPEWQRARERRLAALGASARRVESSGQARYLSRQELRYSLRSVWMYAPWVRRIHLVTAGQVPAWLDVDHPQIRLVDHADILPSDALPTFNSHAIETRLHHIEGLAEQWVYVNDDVFLGRPVRPSLLFTTAGQPRVFFSSEPLGVDEAVGLPPYLRAGQNNRRLLAERFGASITGTLAHTPHAHRVTTLDEIEREYAADVGRTTRTPFRADSDISLLSSFAQHYGLFTGTAVPGHAEHSFVNLAGTKLKSHLERLADQDLDSFCLGDHHDYALQPGQVLEILDAFLTSQFPLAAPWERPG